MEKYIEGKMIGSGSFGQVFLVTRVTDRRVLVMKKMSVGNVSDKEMEAFNLEIKLLSQLDHPGTVTHIESFLHRPTMTLCIVMAYCEGGDLTTYLKLQKGVKLREADIMYHFVQLLLALDYMHMKNILHRDLKTQNIFIQNGMMKLGDFGISKVLDGTNAFASTCIGTPYYMSPELFKNQPYGFKSDIWALGCVLYEMVTLKHAFDAQSLNGLAGKIIKGSYPPIDAKYSKNLRDLVKSMLALLPASRPDTRAIFAKPFIQANVKRFVAYVLRNPSEFPAADIDSLKAQLKRLGFAPLLEEIEKGIADSKVSLPGSGLPGGASIASAAARPTPPPSSSSSSSSSSSAASSRPAAPPPSAADERRAAAQAQAEQRLRELKEEEKQRDALETQLKRLKDNHAAKKRELDSKKNRGQKQVVARKNELEAEQKRKLEEAAKRKAAVVNQRKVAAKQEAVKDSRAKREERLKKQQELEREQKRKEAEIAQKEKENRDREEAYKLEKLRLARKAKELEEQKARDKELPSRAAEDAARVLEEKKKQREMALKTEQDSEDASAAMRMDAIRHRRELISAQMAELEAKLPSIGEEDMSRAGASLRKGPLLSKESKKLPAAFEAPKRKPGASPAVAVPVPVPAAVATSGANPSPPSAPSSSPPPPSSISLDDSPHMSAKDRLMAAKEKKRQEEEAAYKANLAAGRADYHREKQKAEARLRDEYTGDKAAAASAAGQGAAAERAAAAVAQSSSPPSSDPSMLRRRSDDIAEEGDEDEDVDSEEEKELQDEEDEINKLSTMVGEMTLNINAVRNSIDMRAIRQATREAVPDDEDEYMDYGDDFDEKLEEEDEVDEEISRIKDEFAALAGLAYRIRIERTKTLLVEKLGHDQFVEAYKVMKATDEGERQSTETQRALAKVLGKEQARLLHGPFVTLLALEDDC